MFSLYFFRIKAAIFRAFQKRDHFTFLVTKNIFIIPKTWKMFFMKYMHLYRRKHVLNYLQILKTKLWHAMKLAGQGSNKSFTRLVNLFKMKPVLIYRHRNNKYTMTKTNQNQKMIKDQDSFFCYHNRSITFPTRIPPLQSGL